MLKTYNIKLLPEGREISGKAGRSLLETLVDHSILLRSDCGGQGNCGKCSVNILSKSGSKEPVNACMCKVTEELQIEIPESSMLSGITLSKAPVVFPQSFINRRIDHNLGERYGIAVDLGTTTIAIYFCNMTSGTVLSSVAIKNPQALYGDDVMSRIGFINKHQANLKHLQKLVVRSIEWGIGELVESNGLEMDKIARIVAVGNPTMMHILAGIDPKPIGTYPYEPVFYKVLTVKSSEAGFTLRDIPLLFLPQVSGFIGGDILGAALAVDLDDQPEGTLLIDLGTNGELLLKGSDSIFATSCATGPAFEGASLSCGMQAIAGAINRVAITSPVNFPEYTIINPQNLSIINPIGICGTGAISGVAEFCRRKIIEPGGAFVKNNGITPLQRDNEEKLRYVLSHKDYAKREAAVFISQKDIRSIQLGKAALRTGIEFLLKAAGYKKPLKVIIAGAFGTFIDVGDMLRLGMIPPINSGQVELAGNSAGAGAIMVLCDAHFLDKAKDIASRITTVDLISDKKFQEVFIQNLRFPQFRKMTNYSDP